ncbi:hypothetical protein M9Y10_031182 [Tritrichomonas musculus]|uniref:Uncharacterized protein n=1 Tax=Tritrichomonas musculus TaxID=1915356 RepID=A0ABR2H392_9EUKA
MILKRKRDNNSNDKHSQEMTDNIENESNQINGSSSTFATFEFTNILYNSADLRNENDSFECPEPLNEPIENNEKGLQDHEDSFKYDSKDFSEIWV